MGMQRSRYSEKMVPRKGLNIFDRYTAQYPGKATDSLRHGLWGRSKCRLRRLGCRITVHMV